jgi:hypothetical protein
MKYLKKKKKIKQEENNLFLENLPDFSSIHWFNGFIWKGVYLKLFSK